MHADEIDVDDALVRRLLVAQHPRFAGEPLRRIEAWGTDHAIFRLGDRLSVRLPKIGWAAAQGAREHRWLPVLAGHLPVEVPVPVALGRPGEGYPLPWYISPWLRGRHPRPAGPEGRDRPGGATDLDRLAVDLAALVRGLHRADATGAPGPDPARGTRGGPLARADGATRRSAEALRGEADVDALLAVWDAGLRAPPWDRPGRWVHGDLSDGNLLVREGRLTGAIDWSGLLAGDPAVDLMAAWTLFDGPSRAVYREALGFVDDAMWLRGRAWAASAALQALPYYRDTNPDIMARSWRAVGALLSPGERT